MSATQKSSKKEERVMTPQILVCDSEEKFLKSLYDFIEHEKLYLQCPEEDPEELRYIIYRSVFNKVIARSSTYKRILLSIKSEYDSVIRAISKMNNEIRVTQQNLRSSYMKSRSLETCQYRAATLKERISLLNKENAELQREINKQKLLREKSMFIPGLTVAESENPELLDKHLEHLQFQRTALLAKKSRCVSLEVKAKLDTELQARELWRDKLSTENRRLKLLNKRLRCVHECLSIWEEEGQRAPLEELLKSALEGITHATISEDDFYNIDTELLESEEPFGVNDSQYLTDYVDRFVELFDSSQFEEAARHAAYSPHGALRNLQTMNMFKAVTGPPDSPPPLLLFFHSLLRTTPVRERLPESVSYEGVWCALEKGEWQLVTHAVNFNKLTYSERLGDVLTEYAQEDPDEGDVLLALATINFKACGLHRKMALSMCRRGLNHSAVEFMRSCQELTPDDYMWVFCHAPSLCLLQLLTRADGGQDAMLSVGVVCAALLSDSHLQEFALQFLDSFFNRGQGVLEAVMLEDSGSTVDDWNEIASLCSTLDHTHLTHIIFSILLSQSGTGVLSPDLEGAQLTEHIFM